MSTPANGVPAPGPIKSTQRYANKSRVQRCVLQFAYHLGRSRRVEPTGSRQGAIGRLPLVALTLIHLVAIEPTRGCLPSVSDAMQNTCRDKQLLADCWAQDLTADFKLYVTLKHHHEFIHGMGVVFPRLSGRIGPDVAAETTRLPGGAHWIDVNHTGTIKAREAPAVLSVGVGGQQP